MVAALAAAALLPKHLVVDADLAVVPPVVVVDDRGVVAFVVGGAAAPVPRRGAPYCLLAYNAVRT